MKKENNKFCKISKIVKFISEISLSFNDRFQLPYYCLILYIV